ncbi:MAG TPA: hypothetical protein VJ824_05600 [Bacillota bacterium]|nr:hypothetical protein [Bacillota bacterium]
MLKTFLTIEESNLHEYSLGIRYIIKTYKLFGIPVYKKMIPWD